MISDAKSPQSDDVLIEPDQSSGQAEAAIDPGKEAALQATIKIPMANALWACVSITTGMATNPITIDSASDGSD